MSTYIKKDYDSSATLFILLNDREMFEGGSILVRKALRSTPTPHDGSANDEYDDEDDVVMNSGPVGMASKT